jgi:hypothetical protein
MSNKDFLSRPTDIRLSLSDWLLFLGWASAHVTDATPGLITEITASIGRQVQS